MSFKEILSFDANEDPTRSRRTYTAYDPAELRRKVMELLDNIGDVPSTIEQLARKVGCSRPTLRKYVPEVNQLLESREKTRTQNICEKTPLDLWI